MSDKPENPPAFPCSVYDGRQAGMTLRDYFAAAAMQGELSSQHGMSQWTDYQRLAEVAYKAADAMLKARS